LRRAAVLASGLFSLLAACGSPPPKPPAMSDAEIAEVAMRCGTAASAITLQEDKVIFDPPKDISYESSTCVLKELRARVPAMPIGFVASEHNSSEAAEQ
jgi:hypothetical protein